MKRFMKKISILALALVMVVGMSVTSFAAEASVKYEGDADQFVFLPGSAYSPTDLFTDFKGVMPGDTLMQHIEVRNVTDDEYKVVLYMKALGASDLVDQDGNVIVTKEESTELLKELTLKVTPIGGQDYYFNAFANETDGLTDWVCLGEFYKGGNVTLQVDLEVPITLGNDFQQRIGALQWTFKAVEIPAGDNPNENPEEEPGNDDGGDGDDEGDKDKDKDKDGKLDGAKTGDDMNLMLIGGICIAALVLVLILLFTRRRRE